jgi:hypothetical protein
MTKVRAVPGRIGSALKRRLAPWARRQDGAATVEFVLLFPIFILLFISTIEASIMMMRQIMLERALEEATRPIRLGGSGSYQQDILVRDICDNVTILMPDCRESLVVELIPVNMNAFDLHDRTQRCISREQSTRPFANDHRFTTPSSAIMVMRACYAADLLMPTSGLGNVMVADQDNRTMRIVAATAFRIEPE